MGQLILIRHCETESNASGTILGRTNTSLSLRGEHQFELLNTLLRRNFEIDRVVSSDKARCLETARAIDAPLESTPLLRELDFGEWEGHKWSEISEEYPDDYEKLLSSDTEFAPPGGESLSDLDERVSKAINQFNLLTSSESIAVVSHDGTLRSLIARLLGWPVRNMGSLMLFVGSVSEITISEGSPRISRLNHYEHLAPSYEETNAK